MAKPMRLGILTWRRGPYVEEKTFFTHLAQAAEKLNTEVCLFSPHDVIGSGKIRGLAYHKGRGWIPQVFSPPHVVYDRFRNMKPEAFSSFVRFRNQCKLTFLNSRLAHKWNLSRYLENFPEIARWLPETIFMNQSKDALELLQKYKMIYIKPVNGTGGKGILSVTKQAHQQFQALGRDHQRRKIKASFNHSSSLLPFIDRWTKDTKFIAQQGLHLEWEPGLVTDFRLFVQKDGGGNWAITGMGGKIGPKNSATSNLHGGGKAIHPDQFFRQYFSEEKRKQIEQECRELGFKVARCLEEKFGRLLELGIDLGIDKDGKVWIIEINNKPGRDIFRQIGDLEAYRTAVRRPVEYARYIFEKERS